MALATTTALLIGAGIKTGVDIWQAKRAGDAAKDAAQIQSDSGQQALNLYGQMYQQERNDLAPWRDTGGQAMTSLGSLMGLPSGPVGGGDAGLPALGSGTPQPGSPEWKADIEGRISTASSDIAGNMMDGAARREARDRLSDVFRDIHQAGMEQRSESSLRTAKMRSPEGDEDDVPEELVSSFEREGFQRV